MRVFLLPTVLQKVMHPLLRTDIKQHMRFVINSLIVCILIQHKYGYGGWVFTIARSPAAGLLQDYIGNRGE